MTDPKTLIQKLLAEVQAELRAPKDEDNKFGGYKYRGAEAILEAVKPLLHDRQMAITLNDQIVEIGGRVYVEATATVICGIQSHSTTAYAREPDSRKGMDVAQVTGASSSYARKYALCGLLAIDDGRDPDATNRHDSRDDVDDQYVREFLSLMPDLKTNEQCKARAFALDKEAINEATREVCKTHLRKRFKELA